MFCFFSKNSKDLDDKLSEWRNQRRNRSTSPGRRQVKIQATSEVESQTKTNPDQKQTPNAGNESKRMIAKKSENKKSGIAADLDEGIFSNDSSSNTSSANNSGVLVVDVKSILSSTPGNFAVRFNPRKNSSPKKTREI